MQQNRFTRSLTCLAAVLVIQLFGAGNATATPNRLLLQSEESFREQLGERAVQIAKGVYQVQIPSGEQIRVAFGQEGLKYDIARLRAETSALRRELAQEGNAKATANRLRLLAHALASLEQQMAEEERPLGSPRSITANASVDGSVCKGYVYHLDGGHTPGMVGGTTWGEASVESDGFGPYPPGYRCVAYSYVGTTDEYDNFTWDDSTQDQYGSAAAAASTDCGYSSWSCPTWESFNWIRNYGCFNGYRSIHRDQNNPN